MALLYLRGIDESLVRAVNAITGMKGEGQTEVVSEILRKNKLIRDHEEQIVREIKREKKKG